MISTFPFLFFVFLFAFSIDAVKLDDFKRCDQSGFCRRNRAWAETRRRQSTAADGFRWLPNAAKFHEDEGRVGGILEDTRSGHRFTFQLELLEEGIARVQVDEEKARRPRFTAAKDVLIDGLKPLRRTPFQRKDIQNGQALQFGRDKVALLHFEPFSVDFYVSDELVASVNKHGFLNIEHLRAEKPPVDHAASSVESTATTTLEDGTVTTVPVPPAEPTEEEKLMKELEASQWQETFGGNTDSKPWGPQSVGIDVQFPGSDHVYGIPEHATNFSLKTTRGEGGGYTEPYRLYNLDVFEFELDMPVALYGSVPFMMSHKMNTAGTKSYSTGFFWLNTAETWVDVSRHAIHAPLFQANPYSSKQVDLSDRTTTTHWFSESGLLEFFVLLGPEPKTVMRQYAMLTGTQSMPQQFALGYHQCRWNYIDTMDVRQVHDGFEKLDIPMDVLWLDIEHTDDKRYFTWHPSKFTEPAQMQMELAHKGRKMVTIIDPHIKRDDNYYVKKEGSEKGLFVRNAQGNEFDGHCWSGSSSYIDFTNPEARKWWASLFSFDKYKGSTENLFTWNDMNEPSVFNSPEVTMPKDNLHYQDWEHRDVHNIYGMYLHRSTYGGHIMRSLPDSPTNTAKWLHRMSPTNGPKPHRPFVLSRAFFAGTQRYGAIWTGDNMAKWEHLDSASPMLLSISLAGVGFCGADVGGFFFNPSAELLTRWYQAGVFYPFFRGHAHIETKRREPWLFGEPYTTIIRDAILLRYRILPYWYTLFRQNQLSGVTAMRALWLEFPTEPALFGIENQYMVGDAIMVKPVVKPIEEGGSAMDVYLPGNDVWFNFHSHLGYKRASAENPYHHFADIPLSSPIPMLQRAGTVVVTRERIRRSSAGMVRDPITLYITLNAQGESSGEYYLDDGESFMYALRGEFIHKVVTTKLDSTGLTITAKDIELQYYDEDNAPKQQRRLKPYQRPFMGDAALDSSWDDIHRVMTVVPSESYREQMDHIRVERIVVLGAQSQLGNLQSAKSIQTERLKGTTGEVRDTHSLKPSTHLKVEKVTEDSTLYKERAGSAGIVPVWRVTIKEPSRHVGSDWRVSVQI